MVRPGAGTVHFAVWDIEVDKLCEIRREASGEERVQARDLFPCVVIDDLFMERCESNEEYTLFDPKDVRMLNRTYGDEFKLQYEKYEKDYKENPNKYNSNTRVVKARDIMKVIIKARSETGTPFLFFKDNVNRQHKYPQLGIIRQSNLCFTGDTEINIEYNLENDGTGSIASVPNRLMKSIENLVKPLKEVAKYSNGCRSIKVVSSKYNKETNRWENTNSNTHKDAVAFKTGNKREYIKLILSNGDVIQCTDDHPFALKDGSYLEAKDMTNRELVTYSGNTVTVTTIARHETFIEDLYDLSVVDNHNFYVNGKTDRYLVHNCNEIYQPTSPEETAVCNLGSFNYAKIGNDLERAKYVAKLAIRICDNSIDQTDYPSEDSRKTQLARRSIGCGALGIAEWVAMNKLVYGSEEHINRLESLQKTIHDATIEATKELAKEKGSCIIEGVRNAYLHAIAPNSSSGIFASTTNSHEPTFEHFWIEGNKYDKTRMTAPNINNDNKDYYVSVFNLDMKTHIKMTSILQKYIDMGISTNLYYKPEDLSISRMYSDIHYAWKCNLKGLYYSRTKSQDNSSMEILIDGKPEQVNEKYEIKCVGCEN